jgi:peptidoglycan pentaglycine glycine transferase (the first glycine)
MTDPRHRLGLTAWREDDPATWNAFVERARYATFTQLWEWGVLKEAAGWKAVRICVGSDAGGSGGGDREGGGIGEGGDGASSGRIAVAGVQLLLRRVPVVGWRLAYAPRGPIGQLDDPAVRDQLLEALQQLGRDERLATVRADPETGPDDDYGAALLQRPWRRARGIQAPWTRLVDLTRSEEELRRDMRSKHRQYIGKARRENVVIERLEGPDVDSPAIRAALADFHRIVQLTAGRTGFTMRQPVYYEQAWREFAPGGRCRIYFARQGGERVATIFHFLCGTRAVEAWGGMLDEAGPTRANYLLKWHSMMDLREQGYATYDMWGIANTGIRQFKEGFGGQEVRYVGARELAVSPVGDLAVRLAVGGYGTAQRLRARFRGERAPQSETI